MKLIDIVKSSFKYPFNIPKWLILSILTIIGNMIIAFTFVLIGEGDTGILILISIIVLIFILGYVIKY